MGGFGFDFFLWEVSLLALRWRSWLVRVCLILGAALVKASTPWSMPVCLCEVSYLSTTSTSLSSTISRTFCKFYLIYKFSPKMGVLIFLGLIILCRRFALALIMAISSSDPSSLSSQSDWTRLLGGLKYWGSVWVLMSWSVWVPTDRMYVPVFWRWIKTRKINDFSKYLLGEIGFPVLGHVLCPGSIVLAKRFAVLKMLQGILALFEACWLRWEVKPVPLSIEKVNQEEQSYFY